MFVWIVESAGVFYWLLGLAALGLGAAWWSTRRRKLLIATAATLGLIFLVGLLSLVVDTDQKRIQRIISQMAEGVRERNIEKIFQHVSKSFRFRGLDHDQFQGLAQAHLRRGHGSDVSVSSPRLLSRDKNRAQVEFWADVEAARGVPIRCEADFALEEGVWKMIGLEFYVGNTLNKWQI